MVCQAKEMTLITTPVSQVLRPSVTDWDQESTRGQLYTTLSTHGHIFTLTLLTHICAHIHTHYSIGKLIRHEQLPCYWPQGEGVSSERLEEKFDSLVEANDILLERVVSGCVYTGCTISGHDITIDQPVTRVVMS